MINEKEVTLLSYENFFANCYFKKILKKLAQVDEGAGNKSSFWYRLYNIYLTREFQEKLSPELQRQLSIFVKSMRQYFMILEKNGEYVSQLSDLLDKYEKSKLTPTQFFDKVIEIIPRKILRSRQITIVPNQLTDRLPEEGPLVRSDKFKGKKKVVNISFVHFYGTSNDYIPQKRTNYYILSLRSFAKRLNSFLYTLENTKETKEGEINKLPEESEHKEHEGQSEVMQEKEVMQGEKEEKEKKENEEESVKEQTKVMKAISSNEGMKEQRTDRRANEVEQKGEKGEKEKSETAQPDKVVSKNPKKVLDKEEIKQKRDLALLYQMLDNNSIEYIIRRSNFSNPLVKAYFTNRRIDRGFQLFNYVLLNEAKIPTSKVNDIKALAKSFDLSKVSPEEKEILLKLLGRTEDNIMKGASAVKPLADDERKRKAGDLLSKSFKDTISQEVQSEKNDNVEMKRALHDKGAVLEGDESIWESEESEEGKGKKAQKEGKEKEAVQEKKEEKKGTGGFLSSYGIWILAGLGIGAFILFLFFRKSRKADTSYSEYSQYIPRPQVEQEPVQEVESKEEVKKESEEKPREIPRDNTDDYVSYLTNKKKRNVPPTIQELRRR